MALIFPSSPTPGQTYTSGSYSWTWNGSAWASIMQTVPLVANATSASYSITASYATGGPLADTASFVSTASWAQRAVTASYIIAAQTASYVLNSVTASYVVLAQTASYIVTAQTASYTSLAQTASYIVTAQTASYVLNSVTASYIVTAQTASFVTFANVSSKPTGLISSSAQFASTDNFIMGQVTASAVRVTTLYVDTITSSISYASGSNVFGSNIANTQVFTGSILATGSLTVTGAIGATGLVTLDAGTGSLPSILTGVSNVMRLAGTDAVAVNVESICFGTTAFNVRARAIGGTRGSPSATADNQAFWSLGSFGYDNAGYITTNQGRVSIFADGLWSAANRGTKMIVSVTAAGTTTPMVDVLTVTGTGTTIAGALSATGAISGTTLAATTNGLHSYGYTSGVTAAGQGLEVYSDTNHRAYFTQNSSASNQSAFLSQGARFLKSGGSVTAQKSFAGFNGVGMLLDNEASPGFKFYIKGSGATVDDGSVNLLSEITTTGLNSTVIGATTPAAGSFTTLGATGVASFLGLKAQKATATSGFISAIDEGANVYNVLGSRNNADNAYLPMVIRGTTVTLGATSDIATISSTGLAVTGALSATGQISSTLSSGTALTHTQGSVTAVFTASSGGTACIVGTTSNHGTDIYSNNATVGNFTSTGLAVTGCISASSSVSGYGGAELRLLGGAGTENAIATTATGSPSMLFDHRGTSNTGNWKWRYGSAATSTAMELSSTGLAVTGALSATTGFVSIATGNSGAGMFRGAASLAAQQGLDLCDSSDTSNAAFAAWRKASGAVIGSITRVTTTDAVIYNTTSDSRLKENFRDFRDSGRLIDALRPRVFDWKSDTNGDGKNVIGFIAQEEHASDPIFAHIGAVSVGDDDPTTITRQWQRSDSALVPILVAELKDVRARLAALEAKS